MGIKDSSAVRIDVWFNVRQAAIIYIENVVEFTVLRKDQASSI